VAVVAAGVAGAFPTAAGMAAAADLTTLAVAARGA
jgi:hypothetical protein